MRYKEFKALSDAYWLGWDNAQGTLGKDDVSHRSFLTLIQNIMMDKMRLKEGETEREGKWIDMNTSTTMYMPRYKCSICNEWANKSNYCPNCGADMRERREDG